MPTNKIGRVIAKFTTKIRLEAKDITELPQIPFHKGVIRASKEIMVNIPPQVIKQAEIPFKPPETLFQSINTIIAAEISISIAMVM